MTDIIIYTTSWCPSCVNAKAFFDGIGAAYTEIDIERWNDPRGNLEEITGRRSRFGWRYCGRHAGRSVSDDAF